MRRAGRRTRARMCTGAGADPDQGATAEPAAELVRRLGMQHLVHALLFLLGLESQPDRQVEQLREDECRKKRVPARGADSDRLLLEQRRAPAVEDAVDAHTGVDGAEEADRQRADDTAEQ